MNSKSLRDIKKARTREALLGSALELFKKKGYEQTSIEEIARRADYAPRTFFLHFASKEELLFPEAGELQAGLERMFADRVGTALEALKQWMTASEDVKRRQNPEAARLRRRLIGSSLALQARQKLYLGVIEDTLAAAIADDLSISSAAPAARLTAAAAVAVFATVEDMTSAGSSAAETTRLIDAAFSFLEAGMDSLAPGLTLEENQVK